MTSTSGFSIIPIPTSTVRGEGSFTFNVQTALWADMGAGPEAILFGEQLAPALAFPLQMSNAPTTAPTANAVILRLDPEGKEMGDEGYRLTISPERIDIAAYRPAGLFYGCQTIRQMLPPEVFGNKTATGAAWDIPCATIEDAPRFGWRGHLLDVGRHFFSVDEVKRAIDLAAMHKLNVFHWHVTDDQGWRIESKRYPNLTETGAWRTEPGGTRYGGFYTQDQVRDIIAYAARRHVNVVPEIEMPGHATAALASYPELGCTGGPYETVALWGIKKEVYCAGQEQTYQFIYNLLDEMMALFPSEYIHIGGDECPKDRWKACPKCQARMKAEGLKSEEELQSYFVRRIDKYLGHHGRRLIGWDEITEGGLAQGAVVQAWRDSKHGTDAANAGHDVIMSPTSHCYLDYDYDRISLEMAYSYEPIPADLSPDKARHILGLEGNTWAEYVPDVATYDRQTYPRMAALAEVAWSQLRQRDWQDFQLRMDKHKKRLDVLGVNYGGENPGTDATAGQDK